MAGAERADVQRLERHREVLGRARGAGEVQHAVDAARDRDLGRTRRASIEREARIGLRGAATFSRAPGERLSTATTSSPRVEELAAEVRTEEPRAAGDARRGASAPHALVRRTRAGASPPGRAGCGRRRSRRRRIASRDPVEVEPAELVPLGEQRDARRRPSRASYASAHDLEPAAPAGGRSPAAGSNARTVAPSLDKRRAIIDRRRVAQVVGVGLEREAPDRDDRAVRASPPTAARILSTMRSCCASLTSTTPCEQLEVVAGVARRCAAARGDVLREARAAVAGPGCRNSNPMRVS